MHKSITTLAIALAATIATATHGTTIELFDGTVKSGDGYTVSVNYDGDQINSIRAGRFTWNTVNGDNSSPEVYTFCTELTSFVNEGEFTCLDLEDLPTDGPQMNAARVGFLVELYEEHYADAVTFDGGDTYTDQQEAAGFQLAVWEIVYETGTGPGASLTAGDLDLDADNMKVTSANASAQAAAQGYLDSLSGGPADANWYDRVLGLVGPNDGQDQLLVVPLPPAAALAGVGVLGIIVGRRRLARVLR